MKIIRFVFVLIIGAIAACGGGSKSGGGSSDGSFASDMSGTWTGMIDEVGYEMSINHDNGSSSGTGVITYSNGGNGLISMTKNGNDITIVQPDVSMGCDGTFQLTLTSPVTAEGTFGLGPCGFGTATTITRI